MWEDLTTHGAHRAGGLRLPLDAVQKRTSPAVGLIIAGVLGVGAMLAVLALGAGTGGALVGGDRPPPIAAPDPDGWGQPHEPTTEPPIEFTMSAWPSLGVLPPPATTASPAKPTTSPTRRTSPTPSAAASPPRTSIAVPPPPSSPSPAPVTYSAVAGYGCPNSATHGFSEVGRYTDGTIAWYAVTSGGWTGNGCNGRFDAMEMSGYATQDDPSAYVIWSFAVGAASKRCQVATYVPTSANSLDVGGKPAQYFVMDTESGPVRAGFTVDQRYTRGTWVGGGTYTVNDEGLVVKLVNRGEDWTQAGPSFEHIAVAQVRITCTA
jgi:hypothetical protein